ncbi:MAG: DUF1778 domain-containing protein [Roseomonas sp.]|nr:DUF1778 domain-containing protein [Roseomonas sp.]
MVIDQCEPKDTVPVTLSEHDSLRVLALLENPPAPTAQLARAARMLAEFGMDAPE